MFVAKQSATWLFIQLYVWTSGYVLWKGSTAWDCGHRGKVIQSCMENTRDVVETMNSVRGTRVVGYGALQNLGENFNRFALESKHRAHSSGMEGVMLSHLSFSVAI